MTERRKAPPLRETSAIRGGSQPIATIRTDFAAGGRRFEPGWLHHKVITVRTVEANLTRVYRKLGVRSRVELARWFASAAPK